MTRHSQPGLTYHLRAIVRLCRRGVEPVAAVCALGVVVTCAHAMEHPIERSTRAPDVVEEHAWQANSIGDSYGPDASVAGKPLAGPEGSSSAQPSGEPGEPTIRQGSRTRWLREFASLKAKRRTEPLRVLWFGDSHTAADYLPNAVRKYLSQWVELGGPGYVSLGVPGYRHGLAKAWFEGSVELGPHPPARRNREGDGVFGLGGTRATLRDKSAYVAARSNMGATEAKMAYELTYRLVSEDDGIEVIAPEQKYALSASSSTPSTGGLRQLRFVGSSNAVVQIRALGGSPELFGVVMETQRPGLVIDTLGVNGARFGTFLAWQEDTFEYLVQQRQPALVIVAYGTNEVFDPEPIERHAGKLEQVLSRLRRAAPEADCALFGPTDVGKGGEVSRSRVVALDTAERATAERLNCFYFSSFELMNADGGFDGWARQEPPLALGDGIHLSARGYARLGEAFAARLQEEP